MTIARLQCLGENTVADLVDGVLRPHARVDISDHLAGCAACRELVASLAPATPGARPARARTAPAIHQGRYVLERILGEGGMGVVFRAHDTQLKRAIALKVIRPDRLGQESQDRMQQRFLREAQAMAQLNHPHVVTVYDAGIDDDQVFVAMELVEGETLRQWGARSQTLAEIGRVLDQAGRGLAAAHAAGLVHRDFKPDNVLVRTDGRVQVTDFGLARSHDSIDHESAPGRPDSRADTVADTLTATGALAGTPAYMSPEQLGGARAGAASDQYSFCQVAWELFYGQRPYSDARDVMELTRRVAAGELTSPVNASVPSAVEVVLRRGLACEPERRFPDMNALLSALADAIRDPGRPSPRRRWPVRTAVAALVIASAAALLWLTARDGKAPAARGDSPGVRSMRGAPPVSTDVTPVGAVDPAPAPAAAPPAPPAATDDVRDREDEKPAAAPGSRRRRPSPTRARKDADQARPPAGEAERAPDRSDAVFSDPWDLR